MPDPLEAFHKLWPVASVDRSHRNVLRCCWCSVRGRVSVYTVGASCLKALGLCISSLDTIICQALCSGLSHVTELHMECGHGPDPCPRGCLWG